MMTPSVTLPNSGSEPLRCAGFTHDYLATVLKNVAVGSGLYILTLQISAAEHPHPFDCYPGQFVMLDMVPQFAHASLSYLHRQQLPNPQGFMLRRPFSVLTVDKAAQTLEILYKTVGQGTLMMSAWKPGDRTRCLGPLGTGFTLPQKPEQAIMMGGGIGIAPLYWLAEYFQLQSPEAEKPLMLYGVRSAEDIGIQSYLDRVLTASHYHIASIDGSAGKKGFVTHLLSETPELVDGLSHKTHAYICGPNQMMVASVRLLKQLVPHLHVEVSLENPMPCGTGSCFGCVVFCKDSPLPSRSCVDGPVYLADRLYWSDTGPASQFPPEATGTTPPRDGAGCGLSEPAFDHAKVAMVQQAGPGGGC